MGFCLFNNVAVAARHALDHHGMRRILVFDWDVHHGNGTNDAFHTSPEVLYVSIHQSPLFPGTGPMTDVGRGDGEGYTVNLPVSAGSNEQAWLSLVDHVVVPIAMAYEPQLVLVSAGFDAHRSDPLGSCLLESATYGHMARRIQAMARAVDASIGCVLEGGYDLAALAESTAHTLDALSAESGEPAQPVARQEGTRRAVSSLARHWPQLA
jgi:acetoin utilization deacetylase AcuC-like enzyme